MAKLSLEQQLASKDKLMTIKYDYGMAMHGMYMTWSSTQSKYMSREEIVHKIVVCLIDSQ